MNGMPKSFDTTIASPNRTSFLIEDILYRQKNDAGDAADKGYGDAGYDAKIKLETEKVFTQPKVAEKRADKGYMYFQPNVVQGGCGVQEFRQPENGYIQVMGAIGAYLGTPYKSMTDPYFLSQGKSKL